MGYIVKHGNVEINDEEGNRVSLLPGDTVPDHISVDDIRQFMIDGFLMKTKDSAEPADFGTPKEPYNPNDPDGENGKTPPGNENG